MFASEPYHTFVSVDDTLVTKVAKYDGSHSFPATLPLTDCDDWNMAAFDTGFFESSYYLDFSCAGPPCLRTQT